MHVATCLTIAAVNKRAPNERSGDCNSRKVDPVLPSAFKAESGAATRARVRKEKLIAVIYKVGN